MNIIQDFEYHICRAEVAYKRGHTKLAIRNAQAALALCTGNSARANAVAIFIARAHSKLGNYELSNTIYRGLLDEKVYLPPVIMGLLYNNLKNPKKSKRNLALIKIFVR